MKFSSHVLGLVVASIAMPALAEARLCPIHAQPARCAGHRAATSSPRFREEVWSIRAVAMKDGAKSPGRKRKDLSSRARST